MTGDAADLTVDPIVNLRDPHLVELYLHRASADREGHIGPASASSTARALRYAASAAEDIEGLPSSV